MSSAGASFRALVGRIGIALVLCVGLVAVGVVSVDRYISDKVASIPKVQLATSSTSNNGTNFLIIGSDSRAFVDSDAEREAFVDDTTAGQRSDTLMVLHANGDKSFALSFPRDTWVTVPGIGDARINAAFAESPQKVLDTLQHNFDLVVNHYLEVDFETFEGLVNAVGGVPVYFPDPTRDTVTGLGDFTPLGFQLGCSVLDGGQALAYVRSRSPEYFVNGRWRDAGGIPDLDRIERQQAFVRTLGRVAMDTALDDPSTAPDLADAVLPNLKADAGFDRAAFNDLARALLGLRGGTGLEFSTLPTDGATRSGQQVLLVDESEAAPMLERLRGDVVVDPPPPASESTDSGGSSGASSPSDVRVSVRNGSGVDGAAGNALNALVNEGFVAGTVGNDSRGSVARTEVRHRSADIAKAQLVASYVAGADLVVDESVGGDVVVVIGRNFTRIAEVEAPSGDAAVAAPMSPEEACTGEA